MSARKRLYDQFHLDEPWDSEHNKPLAAKMPAVYSSPQVRRSWRQNRLSGADRQRDEFSVMTKERLCDRSPTAQAGPF